MRSVIVNILLVFDSSVVYGYAKEEHAVNRFTDAHSLAMHNVTALKDTQDSADDVANKLRHKMVQRAYQTWHLRHAALDNTVLGKAYLRLSPSRTSPIQSRTSLSPTTFRGTFSKLTSWNNSPLPVPVFRGNPAKALPVAVPGSSSNPHGLFQSSGASSHAAWSHGPWTGAQAVARPQIAARAEPKGPANLPGPREAQAAGEVPRFNSEGDYRGVDLAGGAGIQYNYDQLPDEQGIYQKAPVITPAPDVMDKIGTEQSVPDGFAENFIEDPLFAQNRYVANPEMQEKTNQMLQQKGVTSATIDGTSAGNAAEIGKDFVIRIAKRGDEEQISNLVQVQDPTAGTENEQVRFLVAANRDGSGQLAGCVRVVMPKLATRTTTTLPSQKWASFARGSSVGLELPIYEASFSMFKVSPDFSGKGLESLLMQEMNKIFIKVQEAVTEKERAEQHARYGCSFFEQVTLRILAYVPSGETISDFYSQFGYQTFYDQSEPGFQLLYKEMVVGQKADEGFEDLIPSERGGRRDSIEQIF